MAGLTLVDKDKEPLPLTGGLVARVIEATFDSAYVSGGEALDADDCGLDTIHAVIAPPTVGHTFEYDFDNEKLQVGYGDYSSSSDGAFVEVAADVDLSSVATRMLVIGTV